MLGHALNEILSQNGNHKWRFSVGKLKEMDTLISFKNLLLGKSLLLHISSSILPLKKSKFVSAIPWSFVNNLISTHFLFILISIMYHSSVGCTKMSRESFFSTISVNSEFASKLCPIYCSVGYCGVLSNYYFMMQMRSRQKYFPVLIVSCNPTIPENALHN